MFALAGSSMALPCHLISGNKEVCSVPEKIHHFGFCGSVYAVSSIHSLLHMVQPSLCSLVGNREWSMPCYQGRMSSPLGEELRAAHALHQELVLVPDRVLLLRPREDLPEPLLLVLINPGVEVGGEVDERLRGAAQRLEDVPIVDGERIPRRHAAPLRRLVLQRLHRRRRRSDPPNQTLGCREVDSCGRGGGGLQ